MLFLVAALTNEQIAEQRQQQIAQQLRQRDQLQEQLISSCEKRGFQRGTPEILECAARTGQYLMQQQASTPPTTFGGSYTPGVRTSFGESMMQSTKPSGTYPASTICRPMGADGAILCNNY